MKNVMPPLWFKFPYYRGSIGFRMGDGEDYSDKFYDYLKGLSRDELEEYKLLFPEPKTWQGYWTHTEECFKRIIKTDKNFITFFWTDDGKPEYSINDLKMEYQAGKINHDDFQFLVSHKHLTDNIVLEENNQEYHSVEQCVMVKKAQLFHDKEMEFKIINCNDPKTIKNLGRKVANFDELVWDKVKYSIMLNANYMKFAFNDKLRQLIKNTHSQILVEANPNDEIWGIGLSKDDKFATNPLKWRGENLLGFALMEVRQEIEKVYKNEDLCR